MRIMVSARLATASLGNSLRLQVDFVSSNEITRDPDLAFFLLKEYAYVSQKLCTHLAKVAYFLDYFMNLCGLCIKHVLFEQRSGIDLGHRYNSRRRSKYSATPPHF